MMLILMDKIQPHPTSSESSLPGIELEAGNKENNPL